MTKSESMEFRKAMVMALRLPEWRKVVRRDAEVWALHLEYPV
jgi:hypothetical protein